MILIVKNVALRLTLFSTSDYSENPAPFGAMDKFYPYILFPNGLPETYVSGLRMGFYFKNFFSYRRLKSAGNSNFTHFFRRVATPKKPIELLFFSKGFFKSDVRTSDYFKVKFEPYERFNLEQEHDAEHFSVGKKGGRKRLFLFFPTDFLEKDFCVMFGVVFG